jgi:hypothetical protein
MTSNLPGFEATQLGLVDAGRRAVKTLTKLADGSIQSSDYDHGYEWLFKPFDAGSDFDRMARELRLMAVMERVILCMGAPVAGLDLDQPHVRRWARSALFENTMLAVPRAWIAVDVDDAVVPHGLGDRTRFVEGAIHVRDHLLPEEFHSATMVVSPSARTGLRGPTLLRCRLWHLLDKPYELLALKRWTRGLKAIVGVGDSAIIQAGQPIYVGRAIFLGMADLIPPQMRAVVARGRHDRVSLDVERYEPAVVTIDHKLRTMSTACGDDWRGFLVQTLGGELSFFEPLSKGLGIAARSNDSDAQILAFTLALIAKRADAGRIAQYDAQWIVRTIKRFRDMDDAGRRRREAALARLLGT